MWCFFPLDFTFFLCNENILTFQICVCICTCKSLAVWISMQLKNLCQMFSLKVGDFPVSQGWQCHEIFVQCAHGFTSH